MKEDALFFNKVAGAILSAGLLAMVVGLISSGLFHAEAPEEDAYVIAEEGAEATAGAEASSEPEGPADIVPMMAEADAAKGEKVAKACISCHSFEEGGPTKVGPNLYDIVGRDVGSDSAFSYSDALSGIEGEWTYEKLNEFLYNPGAYASGTKMAYAGVRKDEKRADLIAYLRSLSANPAPLP